MHTKH